MSLKTEFKTDIIERYKNGESTYQIAKNEGCSHLTVFRELKRKGIDTGQRFWTKDEIKRLKKFYPVAPNKKLLKEFFNRTRESIGVMAGKLGLKKGAYETKCEVCGEKFIVIRTKHGRTLCLKCSKKQWETNNKINHQQRQKRWMQKNPEYVQQYREIPENRERINGYLRKYSRQRRKKDPKFRLDQSMGTAIYHALRGKKAGRKWQKLVGYTTRELILRLENQFDDKMNWKNYGFYWCVDHIRPKSSFKYTFPNDPEFKRAWALENLQPLEKTENLRKSNIFKTKR